MDYFFSKIKKTPTIKYTFATMVELNQEIKFLPGVGPKKAELFAKELKIFTVEDLLYYFPYKYLDRTKFYTVAEITEKEQYIQAKGIIRNFQLRGQGRKQFLTAVFSDETGKIDLLWFKGISFIQKNITSGKVYVILGKASRYGGKINIVHPEAEEIAKFQEKISTALAPSYNTSERMKRGYLNSKTIGRIMQATFKAIPSVTPETLPAYLIKELKLMPLGKALRNIHFPENDLTLRTARYRIIFEELFYVQLNLLRQKNYRKVTFRGYAFEKVGNYFNDFYDNHLPFELTNAQKRVIKEIREDLATGKQCNRLLQGDVGSGKTLVAMMVMLIAVGNNFQAALMAPTEILAIQHFETLTEMLAGLGLNIRLLTGSSKTKYRRELHEELQNGTVDILIGTHALIEDVVVFKNLGIVIIDEQHRFGVAQRAKMWKKNKLPPHIIVMTATPIPRTLSMTVYGDLDVSVIDELPPGRKHVTTAHRYDGQRLPVFKFMKGEIAKGRQVYIVYPLIEESEHFEYKDLEDGLESISRAFPPPQYAISVLHGRMKPAEKRKSMDLFVKGTTQIMVATTVIEVGVNVPNATIMIIESADRFGLSQLHQLRGRVGRGADQSYCILMTSFKLSADGRKRIKIMTQTNDGFKISEEDMKLRGPGDIEGTQQSGIPFDLKAANIVRDAEIMQHGRNIANDILEKDPDLSLPKNHILVARMKKMMPSSKNWSPVS